MGPAGRASLREVVALLLLAAAVIAVYLPAPGPEGERLLLGLDHQQLHTRRIEFAREALTASPPALPGWYPRELLGAPFWSNVQSFPFIPTRLALLALCDPFQLFTAAVLVAAALSALFTYLYARRIGLGPAAAAAAGWTFAASGFFAARVLAGHLPLLEAYPALPLLLWLTEATLQARGERPRFARWLVALGLACAAVSLAGHPQLSVYALVVAGLYALARLWRSDRPALAQVGAAMGLGVGCAAFVLWPMLLLTGRSSRVLPLERASNDLALPPGRLLAFFSPWRDGWPAPVTRAAGPAELHLPGPAWFWDTVCYVGWAPWAGLGLLLLLGPGRRALRGRPWRFWCVAGLVAVVLALPLWQQTLSVLPGTFLRSPARQLYVATFALALLLGLAVELVRSLLARAPRRSRQAGLAVGVLLALHAVDLGGHDRAFVVPAARPFDPGPRALRELDARVGRDRVAIDYTIHAGFNRRWDDVGTFDSILLARPYRALLALGGAPATLNVQSLDGSELAPRALQAAGVGLVFTLRPRPDLAPAPDIGPGVYRVARPAARAELFPSARVERADPARTVELLRDPAHDLGRRLLLPPDAPEPPAGGATAPPLAPRAVYERPSSDVIVVRLAGPEGGYLRLLEAFDEGWTARVDGAPAPVVVADGFLLAVPVAPGEHEVVLAYATPGAAAGRWIALACAAGLAALAVGVARRQRASDGTAGRRGPRPGSDAA